MQKIIEKACSKIETKKNNDKQQKQLFFTKFTSKLQKKEKNKQLGHFVVNVYEINDHEENAVRQVLVFKLEVDEMRWERREGKGGGRRRRRRRQNRVR